MKAIARKANDWPTIQQTADDFSISWRVIRAAIERGEIEAIRIGHIRVNPESVERYLAARYSPGI